jgi:hypothetical protein
MQALAPSTPGRSSLAPAAAATAATAAALLAWRCCRHQHGAEQQQSAPAAASSAAEQEGAAAVTRANAPPARDADELQVVLYYKYRDLPDAAEECRWQRSLCQRLQLMGRVRVATEGVNGTLCGSRAALSAYVAEMEAAGWLGIDWKFSAAVRTAGGPPPFSSLLVTEKAEIIALAGAEKGSAALAKLQADAPVGGRHLSPAEWKQALEEAAAAEGRGKASEAGRRSSDNDVVLLDVRNAYEVSREPSR